MIFEEYTIRPINWAKAVFMEMVFLRWGGVFRCKHHLKPKKAEIIGVVFPSGGVSKTPPGFKSGWRFMSEHHPGLKPGGVSKSQVVFL